MTQRVTIGDVTIELDRRGTGPALVYLHGAAGLHGTGPFLDRLAGRFSVHAPAHPGFEGSDLPRSFGTVDDLAYFYLDLLEAWDLTQVVLVGSSFGGWIAAEMAIKSVERVSHLVLIDAVGIKTGAREQRDIADLHLLPDDEIARLWWHDPALAETDLATLSDDRLTRIARNREALTLYAWQPYMHDPKLAGRLHRIRRPALVLWGASDGVAAPDYGRAYAERIPGARFELIAGAGHQPDVEQPARCAETILRFTV